MKKLLLSLSALVILGLPKLSAQIINPGFETWSTDYLAPNAKDPNLGLGHSGWWDFNLTNVNFLGSSPITVFQDSINPHGGSYCAMIVSRGMAKKAWDTLKYYGVTFPDTNGIIYTAYYNAVGHVTVKSGIPCNNNYSSFSFWYRYTPNGRDTCSCTVGMYHWNSVTHMRDLIGGGVWKDTSKVTSWTKATVNIIYDSLSVMPDTIVIVFSACSLSSKPKANDTMYVDDGSVVLGENNITAHHDNVNLYPNPTNNQLNFAVTGQFQANLVEVYDITGKLAGTYSMYNNLLTINTQQYSSGIYFYKMYDNTGAQMNVGKFSVIK